MRVKRFTVEKLHGFIDVDIDLFEDLTIIVGRNGSGKTSALDFMSSLIRLDMSTIYRTRFNSASMTLVDKYDKQIDLNVVSAPREIVMSLRVGHEKLASIAVPIPREGSSELSQAIVSNFNSMLGLRIRKKDTEWGERADFLRSNARVTFVRLDRTILAIDASGVESIEIGSNPRVSRLRRGTTNDPIDDVIRVTRENFIIYQRAADRIQREASSELIRLHFSSDLADLPNKLVKRGARRATEVRLKSTMGALKERVTKSHLISGRQELSTEIEAFFENFENLLQQAFSVPEAGKRSGRRTLKEETLEAMIMIKERQIDELLVIFENEQKNMSDAYNKIENYLNVVNAFLKHSGKEIIFSNDLEISFRITNDFTESSDGILRPIRDLSSGERQIIIILTYLAFLTGEDSIFVVDEPELSLHVTWQRQLVEALQKLRPANCQIILATHSPEIAGRARNKSKILKPKHLPQSN